MKNLLVAEKLLLESSYVPTTIEWVLKILEDKLTNAFCQFIYFHKIHKFVFRSALLYPKQQYSMLRLDVSASF